MTIQHSKNGSQHILYCDASQPPMKNGAFDSDLFEPAILQQQQRIYRTAQGRGTSYFFRYDKNDWVLRHYWRGGIIGKYIRDGYCWQPLSHTRPYLELALLQQLNQWQLPVPTPIAARVTYHDLFYRGDIITGTIVNSQSLVEVMKAQDVSIPWHNIGKTIRRFHQHGVIHADLNAHNILLDDQQQIFLIDFDRGKIVSPNNISQQQSNLSRLKRSLEKEKARQVDLIFDDEIWKELLRGYNG